MKKLIVLLCLGLATSSILGEERFGRPVIKLQDSKDYEFVKLDDLRYPTSSSGKYIVSCLVYRGNERYYAEVDIRNKTTEALHLQTDFVTFSKPGYTVYRTDTMGAAKDVASAVGVRFIPTRAPYVPPTMNTTVNATATTYGDQTQIYGTATTTPDYSGQAGANVGNAIGNAIAAHRFYKAQRTETSFASFLAAHAQPAIGTTLAAGEELTLISTFQQAKQKKAPFEVLVHVGDETFRFKYKE